MEKHKHWLQYQLNGLSAEENYKTQKQKMMKQIKLESKVKDIKQKMNDETVEAVMAAIESSGTFEEKVAINVAEMIKSIVEDGQIHPERLQSKTFTYDFGKTLAQMLAMAPAKLLDSFFDDILKEE